MKEQERSLIALVARILGFLRDHNQHCYTAEALADRDDLKREEIVDSKRMQEICEELCKEGLIEPKREDEVRCYQAVR
jgi:hypothetical protein